ncbi:FAD-binding and (Fe-S)-binding domain-containing protein [Belnapia moabensis]|uniref:FAD-binding and (Fe-S)-binding domain-containing protein n=1 Tax=Belnapia moabensis TaxID=365533 RepID=UPI001FE1B72F|nr:FAD-linked oxidase C-terminal domain-containing protein [Belnapia moabensis]
MIHREHHEEIAARFPRLNRCLTGYDLAHIRTPDRRFDLNAILCGSEGTLGILAEAKLNLLPIPKHSALINLRYASFDAALRDARALTAFGPASIETVDSKVLALAQRDIVWDGVREFFPDDASGPARGINLIEFVGGTEEEVEKPLLRMTAALAAAGQGGGRTGYTVARGEGPVGRIWGDAQALGRAATHDRRHSPKGRAMLVKEWLRRLSAAGVDPVAETRRLRRTAMWRGFPARMRNTLARRRGEEDFSHAVKEAMDGCLACKSCVGGCPIKVNVPGFRAKFLELYYGRYLRPPRDHVAGALEHLLPVMARASRLADAVVSGPVGRTGLRWLGLVDTPRLSGIDLRAELAMRGLALATPEALRALSEAERRRAVILVQDASTTHYETQLVLDVLDLLRLLGVTPWLAPYRPNGKALHVHGFLGAFGRVAASNAAGLRALAGTGVALVGIDPSMTLTYRAEYAEALDGRDLPNVLLLQQWLSRQAMDGPRAGPARYRLLAHCTERITATASLRDWQSVFARHGLELEVLAAGCCGMAGTYGHEAEHRGTSERIYDQSWRRHVAVPVSAGGLLATGYSCRSQAKRLDGVALPHPAQALLQALRRADPAPA